VIAPDGREVWIHDAAVVVRDEVGSPLYAQGYMIDITDRKRNEDALRASQDRLREQMQKIEYQALHDALTDMPNRTLFHDRAEQALLRANREGSGFAVMLLDLEPVQGRQRHTRHHSGDLLLREIAGRLRRALRRAIQSRASAVTSSVSLRRVSQTRFRARARDKLRYELGQPVVVGGLAIEVEASAGIAIYPTMGDVETLIRHADVSMYVSKNTHTPIVYAATYDHHSLARLALMGELRRALENNELIVHYQPETDAGDRRSAQVEALVRWQHLNMGCGP